MLKYVNSTISTFLKARIKNVSYYINKPLESQSEVFKSIISCGKETSFGKEHNYKEIKDWKQFTKNVPVQNYDSLKPYIIRILEKKEKNVLWNTPVKWFAMSSGTTSDKSKYIPVTKESLNECHYKGGKEMLAMYIDRHPDTNIFTGKSLILGGSQQINKLSNDIYTGDVSSVIVNNLPIWARLFRASDKKTVLLPDWEEKIHKLAKDAIDHNITSLSGVPSWLLVLLKHITKASGKTIPELWPDLEVFFHGGVSFVPYIEQYKKLVPESQMTYWENYNASEGYFGFQYSEDSKDLLLMLNNGVYYEFMPMEEWEKENPKTMPLEDVKTGVNYALIISTNGGLWRYLIGDTIQFTSTKPYLFKITGRTKHFINAFGEELIIENTNTAIAEACNKTNSMVSEYTAAPVFFTDNNNGAHEWIIEFDKKPKDINLFTEELDKALMKLNSDYEAKRSYNLSMQKPIINVVEKGAFYSWMKSRNKLGGQNKIPRLANDRKYVDSIKEYFNL